MRAIGFGLLKAILQCIAKASVMLRSLSMLDASPFAVRLIQSRKRQVVVRAIGFGLLKAIPQCIAKASVMLRALPTLNASAFAARLVSECET